MTVVHADSLLEDFDRLAIEILARAILAADALVDAMQRLRD